MAYFTKTYGVKEEWVTPFEVIPIIHTTKGDLTAMTVVEESKKIQGIKSRCDNIIRIWCSARDYDNRMNRKPTPHNIYNCVDTERAWMKQKPLHTSLVSMKAQCWLASTLENRYEVKACLFQH